ncbi:hypothetical protein ACFX1R_018379 [Malus domestica]
MGAVQPLVSDLRRLRHPLQEFRLEMGAHATLLRDQFSQARFGSPQDCGFLLLGSRSAAGVAAAGDTEERYCENVSETRVHLFAFFSSCCVHGCCLNGMSIYSLSQSCSSVDIRYVLLINPFKFSEFNLQ